MITATIQNSKTDRVTTRTYGNVDEAKADLRGVEVAYKAEWKREPDGSWIIEGGPFRVKLVMVNEG